MSRIGKVPIKLPNGVTAALNDGVVTIKGPKGELNQEILTEVSLELGADELSVKRNNDLKLARSQHGLTRSLVNNMVIGVSEGFSKQLEVNGVGFKINVSGKSLKMALGFSHEVVYQVPDDIEISVDGNVITVAGISKQRVGQIAAEIRSLKKPEPYKGNGIKYIDEQIIRKAGKAAGGGD